MSDQVFAIQKRDARFTFPCAVCNVRMIAGRSQFTLCTEHAMKMAEALDMALHPKSRREPVR